MADRTARRPGANEALFREVNEPIERGQWPGDEDAQGAFRCGARGATVSSSCR
jgi:hypothetical protein